MLFGRPIERSEDRSFDETFLKVSMKGSQGIRRKTRKIRVKPRERGKLKIKRYLQEFLVGEKVSIKIDPKYQSIPNARYQGRTGKVVGKQGRAYYVLIKDGSKEKNILVTPEHLLTT